MLVTLEMNLDDVKVMARVLEEKMARPDGADKVYEILAEYLEAVIEEME